MTTERSSFGLNSILPTSYRSKAEAFAKCLQDKLRSLSGLEDPIDDKSDQGIEDTPPTPHGSFSKYSEEEIADNVFLQGPLSYKRRSIPERTGPLVTNGRYIGSVVDRRGFSSDSEESETEETLAPLENAVHRRVVELQTQRDSHKRLTSVNSVDSTTSWCSCEDPDDDEDEVIDTFASQIKGSPTIQNPRMRNFKRKNSKNAKEESPASAPAENDLFFDFDVECFSPVNLDEDFDEASLFESTQLHFLPVGSTVSGEDINDVTADTGQIQPTDLILTPPPSPAKADLQNPPILNNLDDHVVLKSDDEKEQVKESVSNVSREELASLLNQNCKEESTCEPEVPIYDKMERYEESMEAVGDAETSCDVEKHETEHNEKDVPVTSGDFVSNSNIRVVETDLPYVHEQIALPEMKLEVRECPRLSISELRTAEDVVEIISEDAAHLTLQSEVLDVREGAEIAPDEPEDSKYVEDETRALKSGLETELEENLDVSTDDAEKSEVATIVITSCDSSEVEDAVSPRMKLRRCSSLKTWKTPPGTPGRKKIVRFADALGLDLADIRTFLDEIPKIPRSAFEDLDVESQPVPAPPPVTERTLLPMFQQPGMQQDFLQRVRQNNVSLESAILTDLSLLSISGIVRVRNLSFHKSVHIRYTKDSWETYSDLQATYVPGSSDGFAENFSFTLYGHTLNIGDRIEFAVRYDSAAGQFWDNNGGINYVFQCMPRGPMPLFQPLGSSPVDTWSKFY